MNDLAVDGGHDILVAAVDWGGTWIRAAAVSGGRIVRKDRRAKPSSLTEQYLTVAEMVLSITAHLGRSPAAVGVGLAGVVQEGIVGSALNLGFTDGTDVAAALRPHLPLPAYLLNDAQATALGVAARWPHGTTAVLTMGTGIGGAVIRNGSLDSGLGGAGDFGHVVIDVDGPRCPCGGTGCLEVLVSGRHLAEAANALAEDGLSPLLAARAHSGRALHAGDLQDAAESGDGRAADVLDRSAVALSAGLRTIVATHDPQRIVLAGATLAPDTWFGRAVRTHWDRTRPRWARTELHHVGDDEDAALLGAASHALDRFTAAS
ncbi:ROK family protein [Dactylosporangium sp. AC04546]|uniref:ROK family protein n=1 Tax=Dactylosporangium sp. AC04546 TaxID=2862460 RepID=UPI001EDF7ACD|nr:ROK family protein [Dactylosporangium sp. AC04546]WVK87056.1 ROK family protein [Dactylosporangium sp. AC04546]